MFIDDKELKFMLGKAECDGVDRARKTLVFIHKHKMEQEKNIEKKAWHENEYKRLLDDDRWNLLEE